MRKCAFADIIIYRPTAGQGIWNNPPLEYAFPGAEDADNQQDGTGDSNKRAERTVSDHSPQFDGRSLIALRRHAELHAKPCCRLLVKLMYKKIIDKGVCVVREGL